MAASSRCFLGPSESCDYTAPAEGVTNSFPQRDAHVHGWGKAEPVGNKMLKDDGVQAGAPDSNKTLTE